MLLKDDNYNDRYEQRMGRWLKESDSRSTGSGLESSNGTKYSRMDQVKFVEDSL